MKEVLDDIERWRAAGQRVAIARVVGTEGSSPRDPGATMVVSETGEVAGSVSGGCVEGAVVETALAIWVLSGYAPGMCALVQTVLLVTLNVNGLVWARRLIHDPAGMVVKNIAFLVLVWVCGAASHP